MNPVYGVLAPGEKPDIQEFAVADVAAQLPSPRQKVEDVAPVPAFSAVTGTFPAEDIRTCPFQLRASAVSFASATSAEFALLRHPRKSPDSMPMKPVAAGLADDETIRE